MNDERRAFMRQRIRLAVSRSKESRDRLGCFASWLIADAEFSAAEWQEFMRELNKENDDADVKEWAKRKGVK